jgi:hypothetical protein
MVAATVNASGVAAIGNPHLMDLFDTPGVEEDALRGGCLPRVDVRADTDVTDVRKVLLLLGSHRFQRDRQRRKRGRQGATLGPDHVRGRATGSVARRRSRRALCKLR